MEDLIVVICFLVGTLFLIIFSYNVLFFKKPKIKKALKVTVLNCELSQSRMAQNMRKDKFPHDFYDITYQWTDKDGNTQTAIETKSYREKIGETKMMIIERKSNGHQELIELAEHKNHYIWIYLSLGIALYALIGFFYLTKAMPPLIPNLKENGFGMMIGLGFLILSTAFKDEYKELRQLMKDKNINKKQKAEIVKYIPEKDDDGNKTGYYFVQYKYTDEDGVEKTIKDHVPIQVFSKKKGKIVTINIDKQTGRILRKSRAISFFVTAMFFRAVGILLILTFFTNAIFNSI